MPSRLLDGQAWATRGGAVVARAHTVNYRFTLTLAPGSYAVNAKPDDPNYPRCIPVNVTVPPGAYVDVSLDCAGA